MDVRKLAAAVGDVELTKVHVFVMVLAAGHVLAVCVWLFLNLRPQGANTMAPLPTRPGPSEARGDLRDTGQRISKLRKRAKAQRADATTSSVATERRRRRRNEAEEENSSGVENESTKSK